MAKTTFEWDEAKNLANQKKHGVRFVDAQIAFTDPHRVIAGDEQHSINEDRSYCVGLVNGGILTVRFTYRGSVIRIIGAGYWRKGKVLYETRNSVHR